MFHLHRRPESGPQLTPWGFYARRPEKARVPARMVAIGLALALVLLAAGCVAVLGAVAQQMGGAFDAAPARFEHLVRTKVAEGQGFDFAGVRAAPGWEVAERVVDTATGSAPRVTITGLQVTNTGDATEVMRHAFTLRNGSEWVADIECYCHEIEPGETGLMHCKVVAAPAPLTYDAIVVADSY
ncbi:hypothetical protein [Nocardioides sp.]|uniref:hypothetical protein n=1 Tax=Nocardioides sp. TaxID=35761 RepID=UPI002ED98C5E